MSELPDKSSHQEARGLHSIPDAPMDDLDAGLSDQQILLNGSEPKSEAEKQKSPDNVYGPRFPAVLAKILGPPPIVGNEGPKLYGEFFRHFTDEYDPHEITDWLYVIDLAHLHWERLRERRLKPEAIKICQETPDEESNQNVTYIITPADARL
jgi:hypothetical protein